MSGYIFMYGCAVSGYAVDGGVSGEVMGFESS
jgi:hypothetical protein